MAKIKGDAISCALTLLLTNRKPDDIAKHLVDALGDDVGTTLVYRLADVAGVKIALSICAADILRDLKHERDRVFTGTYQQLKDAVLGVNEEHVVSDEAYSELHGEIMDALSPLLSTEEELDEQTMD